MPYYRQACAKLSHVGIVFAHWSKNGFFTLQGQHVAPVLNFIFIATEMWEYSLQNCQIRILVINLPLTVVRVYSY